MADDDDEIPSHYPLADITPPEFERFVADFLRGAGRGLENYRVAPHEVITGVDGTFDFDATVRYRLLGMDFLVVIEAKCHSNPIKRDVIQVLHHKALSVGAHKAWLISTARFQRGAVVLAKVHGIALLTVTEGRFTFETRAATPIPPPSREEAAARGIPSFVAVNCEAGDKSNSYTSGVVMADDAHRLRELLRAGSDDVGGMGPHAGR